MAEAYWKRVKGVEPDATSQKTPEKPHVLEADAKNALVTLSLPIAADDSLRQVVAAWPALPDAIRAAVLALVRAGKA